MANNRWIQTGTSTTPSGVQYGDDVVLKDGTLRIVNSDGDIVGINAVNAKNADKLGGQLPSYYASNASVDVSSTKLPTQPNIDFTANYICKFKNLVFVDYAARYSSGDGILNSSVIGTLPSGFRPADQRIVSAVAMAADRSTLYLIDLAIGPDGTITVNFPDASYKCRWVKSNFWFPIV